MKKQIIFLRIAGVICLLFTMFHFAFQKMFHWAQSLSCLSQSDRSIMLTYHYISILIVGYMAFVLLFQTRTLLNSSMKTSILGLFSAFYFTRIVTEFTNFGFMMPHSLIIILMCVLPVSIFLYAMIYKTNPDAN